MNLNTVEKLHTKSLHHLLGATSYITKHTYHPIEGQQVIHDLLWYEDSHFMSQGSTSTIKTKS